MYLLADAVFGSDLSEEVEKSRMEAPWVVVKCVQEIEQWCQDYSEYCSPHCYIFKHHPVHACASKTPSCSLLCFLTPSCSLLCF